MRRTIGFGLGLLSGMLYRIGGWFEGASDHVIDAERRFVSEEEWDEFSRRRRPVRADRDDGLKSPREHFIEMYAEDVAAAYTRKDATP